MAEWSRGAVELSEAAGFAHELFVQQAERTPDARAVTCGTASLSYAALEARANQLAHHLRALGVGRESRVGLLCSRSVEMVVGVLGILKAGGAYVPLEASHPDERLWAMLGDAEVMAIVTQGALSERLQLRPEPIVLLDDEHELSLEATWAPSVELSGANLAYVMFTSGSTGRPKGVQVTHGGLSAYLSFAMSAYESGAGEAALVQSPLSFDLTVTSLLCPLLSGSGVELVAEEA